MKRRLDVRELSHATVPVVFAVVVLATAPLWQRWLAVPEPGSISPVLALTGIASLAALYAPMGRRTLSLGTLALPAALWFFGVAWAGWVAGGAFLIRELLGRLFFGAPLRRTGGIGLLLTVAEAARVVLATVVGGTLWLAGLKGGIGEAAVRPYLIWGLIGVAGYVATLRLLHWIEARDLGPAGDRSVGYASRFFPLDVVGWFVGALLARIIFVAGWFEALLVMAGVALLAAEGARNLYLHRQAVARVTELWEVTRAGHRIIFRDPDLASMAGHVLEECRNVMPFHWFQFELLQGGEEAQSWCAGPDGHIEEGTPEPADSPPALPGIHRRSSWKILQRQLKGDGEPIALLRFWCDPRQLETTAIELLDSLLPQVAASVHRALLDRRAKQDPLTGLADRRVLEARLARVFAETHEEGGSMAVIMCDLDRFKKINDKHGHDVGDQALLQIVQLLEEHRRDTDLCSRYGGEEFALVLEKTDGATALRVAERLRRAVEHCLFVPNRAPIPLRLSAGVAAYPELHVKESKDLLLLADEALMEAKRKGRNRSLLNLGRGRFRTPIGKTLEDKETPSEPEAPTLFA